MIGERRKTGIDVIGDVHWGTHFCQFYQTKEDVLDILVPYFKAGLGNNEFCMWVTAEPLGAKEAKEAIKRAVPDFDRYLKRRQIEIIPHSEWYPKDGAFDLQRVLNGWVDKLNQALTDGYDGIRVTGNAAWLEKRDWRSFTDYEEEVNNVIGKYRMLAICTYSLDKCGASEIMDVVKNHQFALTRREGKWELIESSERKQAEEALRESEKKYRRLFDLSPIGITIVDMKGVITACNPAVYQEGGYSEDELIGKHFSKIAPLRARDIPKYIRMFSSIIRGKASPPFEVAYNRKDGTTGWTAIHVGLLEAGGKKLGVQVLQRDITERKQAEEALRESEEKHRAIFEQAAESIVLVDAETGEMVEFNDKAYENLGYSREEFEKLKIPDFEDIESAGEVAKHIEKIVKEGSDVFETQHRTKSGERRDIQVSSRAIDIGGRKFCQSIWRDITERKKAEEELRESEEKYRSLVNNIKLGVFRSTPAPSGKFLEVNPAMEEITGYRRKELLQMNVSDLYIYPEERERVLEEVASGRGKAAKEVHFRKKDGTEIVVLDRKVAVRDSAGKILYFDGIIEDITERKQAEEKEKELQHELHLSSRLAAIGELAAGVAHEINNPLTGIVGFSQRLLRKNADETVSRDLARIHNEARRASKVVQNLLTFARRSEPEKEYSDINEILGRTLELRAYELRTSNIELVVELAPGLPKINVDFHQIQEVFLNIILNAEQAMTEADGGGKLSIKTEDTKGYITISFTDDGPGIPLENIDKLFDPFFTTRRERGGTGLGLSVSYGIVAEHGGRIYAKSKPGKGTTFFVKLPVTTESIIDP